MFFRENMQFYKFFVFLNSPSKPLLSSGDSGFANRYLFKNNVEIFSPLSTYIKRFERRFYRFIISPKLSVVGSASFRSFEFLYILMSSYVVNDIFYIGYYGRCTPSGFVIVNFDDSVNFPWADWLIFADFQKRVPIRMVQYRERYFFALTNLTEPAFGNLTEFRWFKYLIWYAFYSLNRVDPVRVGFHYFRFPTMYRLMRLQSATLLDLISVLWANANTGVQFAFFKRPLLPSYTRRRDIIYMFKVVEGYREINSLTAYTPQLKWISEGNVYWEYLRMYCGWGYEKPLVYVQNFAINYSNWVSRNTNAFWGFRDGLRRRGFRKHEVEQLRLFSEINHEEDAARQWDEKLDYLRKVLRGEITIYTNLMDSIPHASYEELIDQQLGEWSFGKKTMIPNFEIPISEIPVWFPLTEYSKVSGYNPETRIFLRRSLARRLNQRLWRLNERGLADECITRRMLQDQDLSLLYSFTIFHSF